MKCNYPGCEKQRDPDWAYGPVTCKSHAAPCCDGTGVEPARNHDDPKWCPCSGCGGKGYVSDRESDRSADLGGTRPDRTADRKEYVEALERTDTALRALLAGKPVRDADEILVRNAWLLFAEPQA